jgi:hypothetical protein
LWLVSRSGLVVPNLGRPNECWKSLAPTKKKRKGRQTLALLFNELADLHVVQRATTPAREPAPIAVDVVARAVIEARVKHGPPVTTACLIRIGVFLDPSATLLVRLFAGLFISHNVVLWFFVVYRPRAT